MKERDIGSWILPQPIEKEKYVPIPRLSRHTEIPFGYRVDDEDDMLLQPIPKELEALEMAKKYLKQYSATAVSAWLTKQTGRSIKAGSLRNRIKNEVDRKKRHAYYRSLAERYKKALQKAAQYEERLSKSEQTGWFEGSFYQSLSSAWESGGDNSSRA
jgi:hypothetical protein